MVPVIAGNFLEQDQPALPGESLKGAYSAAFHFLHHHRAETVLHVADIFRGFFQGLSVRQ